MRNYFISLTGISANKAVLSLAKSVLMSTSIPLVFKIVTHLGSILSVMSTFLSVKAIFLMCVSRWFLDMLDLTERVVEWGPCRMT